MKKMKKVVIIVGSGFSHAFTEGGDQVRVIGNKPVPTLSGLAQAVFDHMMTDWKKSEYEEKIQQLFSEETIKATINRLGQFIEDEYDFEQIMSFFSIKASFVDYLPSNNPISLVQTKAEFECLTYALASCFAACLFMFKTTDSILCQSIVAYAIHNKKTFDAFREKLNNLEQKHHVTFISFNYDGILETLLYDPDTKDIAKMMSTKEERSLQELCFSTCKIEHLYGIPTTTSIPKKENTSMLLKPHGSIHFFETSKEISRLSGLPSLIAQKLILIPGSAEKDIPLLSCIEYTSPIPFIIPPVFNKDSYFVSDYSKVIMRKTLIALLEADVIISIGFSIPPSDIYIRTLFDIVNQHSNNVQFNKKKIGLIYKANSNDKTEANWKSIFTSNEVEIISKEGLVVSSVESINEMWEKIDQWIDRRAYA